jgi:anti-sigma B factor antagonist
MRNFKVTREQRGDVILLKLQGYLNDLGGEEVERLFESEVKEGYKKFVIDFGKIAYINSIGVSFLVGIMEATREKTLKVCFTSLSKINEELFEMVGLKKYSATFSSNFEAYEYLKKV